MTRLELDPALVEEAVFLHIRRAEEQGDARTRVWDHERQAIYARSDPTERERAFVEHGRRWFELLGLERQLTDALQSAPRLHGSLAEIRVRRAVGTRDEGSDLFDVRGATRFELALAPARFLDPAGLAEFVVRECLYADDMLDPAFGYEADLGPGLGGERARTELVRDRLSVLWEARTRGRVARRRGAAIPLEPTQAFLRAFAGASDALTRTLYERAACGVLSTFSSLLAAARGELEVLPHVGNAAARVARATNGSPS